jgi:Raf kinase inhibitor-like YbhB/YbcL family protein
MSDGTVKIWWRLPHWSYLLVLAAVSAITQAGDELMEMTITSSAFAHNGSIPKLYTCEGKDISPPLAWGGVPNGAKSLVMIADDPDAPDPAAPRRTWVHWLLYNLPVDSSGLPEAVHSLPAGTLNGLNDWQRSGYGGPCPPIGRHRYFHKLYALDVVLPDLKEPTKKALEEAMKGHVVAEAQLLGTYQIKGVDLAADGHLARIDCCVLMRAARTIVASRHSWHFCSPMRDSPGNHQAWARCFSGGRLTSFLQGTT